MGIISKVLGVVGGVIGLAQTWLTDRMRQKDRDAGANQERVKTLGAGIKAAEKKRKIEHEVSRLDDDTRRARFARLVRRKARPSANDK